MAKVHAFESTGEAYDACQCNEEIKNGDILVVSSEQVIGIACTWPFAITENNGSFHTIANNDAGRAIIAEYRRSIIEAKMRAMGAGYAISSGF